MEQKELIAQPDYGTPLQLSQTLRGTIRSVDEAQSSGVIASPQLDADSEKSAPLDELALVDATATV